MPTSQADKHISFRLSGGGATLSLTLPLNPSVLQLDWPLRQSVTQTLGGIFKDVSDLGVPSISLQGNTGWKGAGGLDGFQIAQNLFKLYQEYPSRFKATNGNVELLMIDDIDGYTYSITMDSFQMVRDKSQPLLFQYTIPITILKIMSEPTPVSDTVQQLANNAQNNASNAVSIANSQSRAQATYYTVQPGDALWTIAQNYYGDGNQYILIAQANNISAPYTIYTGQVLTIPAG